MSFSVTWTDLEISVLSQKEKNWYHMKTLFCGIFKKKKDTNELNIQNRKRPTDIEGKCMATKWESGEG